MNKKQIIGIVIFVVLILGIVGYKYLTDNGNKVVGGVTTIYVATGGGKEDFLADEDVLKILRKKYKLEVVFDSWSNGKTVQLPLIRESVGLGNQNIANDIASGNTSYTKSSSEWNDAFKKYSNVLNSINSGGYTVYPNVNEFFGDVTVAYFKNPYEVKALCPEVYNLMNNMLDGEYGYSYNDRILAILAKN